MTARQNKPRQIPANIDFETLFETAPGLFLVLQPDAPVFTIIAVSEAYLRATNTKRKDILGKGLFDVFPDNPDDPAANGAANLHASLDRAIATQRADTMAVQKYDIPRPASKGGGFEVRYWSPLNTPVLDESGAVKYLIHRVEDVSEFVVTKQHHAEQTKLAEELRSRAGEMEVEIYQRAQEIQAINRQLHAANQQLSQLNSAKDEFISIVSHQLRTPATGVKQYLGMLREGFVGSLTGPQMMALEHAYQSNERQLKVIEDMLQVARLDAGRINLKKAPTDLVALVADVIDEQTQKITARHQQIIFDRPKQQLIVEADPELIRMVFENLVDNASKYTPTDKQIAIRLLKTPTEAHVAIEDEGIGIDKADLPKLFKKFSRITTTDQARSIDGSGIGLYWVDRVVSIHGGRVDVASQPGQGTKFTVRLPRGRSKQLTAAHAP